jgi:hypothetical protein
VQTRFLPSLIDDFRDESSQNKHPVSSQTHQSRTQTARIP